MNTQALRLAMRATAAAAVLALGTGPAWSADPAPPGPAAAKPGLSKETREKMAAMHEKMAACLRSDKTMAECRSEMIKSCRDTLGPGQCPMGTGQGRMMRGPPKSDSGK